MRGFVKYLLPLCLVTVLGGCADGYYNGGSYGYASNGYYGDYSYAPSYGLGFSYYGDDSGNDHWRHGAPGNNWGSRGNSNNGHDQWRWHSANNGWHRGGR